MVGGDAVHGGSVVSPFFPPKIYGVVCYVVKLFDAKDLRINVSSSIVRCEREDKVERTTTTPDRHIQGIIQLNT